MNKINNEDGKIHFLVEVMGLDISINRCPNMAAAKEDMLERFQDVIARSCACDTISEKEARAILFKGADAWKVEGASLGAMTAEVLDGPNHDSYGWKIVVYPLEKPVPAMLLSAATHKPENFKKNTKRTI